MQGAVSSTSQLSIALALSSSTLVSSQGYCFLGQFWRGYVPRDYLLKDKNHWIARLIVRHNQEVRRWS